MHLYLNMASMKAFTKLFTKTVFLLSETYLGEGLAQTGRRSASGTAVLRLLNGLAMRSCNYSARQKAECQPSVLPSALASSCPLRMPRPSPISFGLAVSLPRSMSTRESCRCPCSLIPACPHALQLKRFAS